jgi:ribonuclease BN (tRNA processing enzyme)
MKLTVFGINGPFPAPGGACSGYLLSSDSGKTNVLIECGSGILARLTRFIDITQLSGIVLSHLHYDHMSDIMVLHYMLQFTELKQNIPVIAPGEPETVHRLMENDKLDLIQPRKISIGEMDFTFAHAVHPVTAVSVKAQCDGRTFVYTGDTNMNPDIELFAHGADFLLADAGLSSELWSPNAPHLSAKLCGELAKNAGAGRLLLTHLRPGLDPDLLLEEARRAYPPAELAKAGSHYII